MDVLPSLIPIALSILETLIRTILDNLPMVLDAGIKAIISLAEGISSMLPTLIPLAINAILNLVETLLDNIDLIVNAGISLIMGLADGLLNALPIIIDRAPVIIDKLITAITNNLPKLIQMGAELTVKLAGGLIKATPQLISTGASMLSGLFKGLLDPTAIWNAVKGLFNGIVGGLKDLFGIHSPSTVFRDEVGKNLALGLGEGFSDTMGDVTADMQGAIPTEFDTNVNMSTSSSAYGSNYNYLVSAFKEALKDVKVVMNNREMGAFIVNTVEREVYA